MATKYTDTAYNCNTKLDIPQFTRCGQIMPMGYLDQLAILRKQKGFTQASLAERIGVEQPTVQRWEKGKREPDLGQLNKLAEVLNVEISELLVPSSSLQTVPLGPKLFVKGEVAAGKWCEAYELPQDEWQTFTGRADVDVDLKHRFGLRVEGDSMDMLYPEGTIVECVSVFSEVDLEPGKRVVVIREDDKGLLEATVKELVETDGELWLVPRSTNPSHAPWKVSEPPTGTIEVRITAVVVASFRPE